MSLDTITLDEALRIMTLPRVVGADADGNEITAANGRYGPYIARTVEGKADYRSLASEEQLFTVTLDEAWRSTRHRSSGGASSGRPPLHCESSVRTRPAVAPSPCARASSART